MDLDEWQFSAVPPHLRAEIPKFKVPRFTRPLSRWLNLVIDSGFRVERVEEPRPSEAAIDACPQIQDARVTAFFLHIRARKP